MDELIRRSDALNLFKIHGMVVLRDFKELPAVDAVERAVYEQVAWERDIAIKQLADIGKSLGAKMDDVATVVRCRECRYFCKGENDSESWEWCDCWKKDCWEDCYCACGQRRKEEHNAAD